MKSDDCFKVWPEFEFLLTRGFTIQAISENPSPVLARAILKGPKFFIRLDADRCDRMIDIGAEADKFYGLEYVFELLQPGQKIDPLDMAGMAAFAQTHWQELEEFCVQSDWVIRLKALEDARRVEVMKKYS